MKLKRGTTLLISFVALTALIFSLPQPAYSVQKQKLTRRSRTTGTTRALTSKKQEARKIEKEIEKKKERVKEVIKKERSTLSMLEDIDRMIRKKQQELKLYDNRISDTESKIDTLSNEIELLDDKLGHKKQYLKERLRVLYKQQYGNYALSLISAKDYQDLIRRSKYISLIAYHDSRIVGRYKSEIAEISSKKNAMETLKATLRKNKRDAEGKEKELQTERIKKDRLLATIRSKRSTYEKTIKELEESAEKLQKMIQTLKKRSIPTSVTGKGIRAYRGHLPWPVNGKVLIPFGKHQDPKFNITVFKNGVELSATAGETPKAVAGGRVVYADWFKGYGLLLIINHGKGYHSLYGNLSEIFHKTGDIINKGTAVGKVGTSRTLNVPALYFEIRRKGKPIDPAEWLKRKHR